MILFYPLTLNTSYREGGDKVYTYYPNSGHFHLFSEVIFYENVIQLLSIFINAHRFWLMRPLNDKIGSFARKNNNRNFLSYISYLYLNFITKFSWIIKYIHKTTHLFIFNSQCTLVLQFMSSNDIETINEPYPLQPKSMIK